MQSSDIIKRYESYIYYAVKSQLPDTETKDKSIITKYEIMICEIEIKRRIANETRLIQSREASEMEKHADACPWYNLRTTANKKTCPVMTAALDYLDAKFKPGVAYCVLKPLIVEQEGQTVEMDNHIYPHYETMMETFKDLALILFDNYQHSHGLDEKAIYEKHAEYIKAKNARFNSNRIFKYEVPNIEELGEDYIRVLFDIEKAINFRSCVSSCN